jgi:hypothetical protein
MALVADISVGESEFDPTFLSILEKSEIRRDEFEGLDYFTWLPLFVIAGASVTPKIEAHGDHTHFDGATLEVPDELLQLFYEALPGLLAAVEFD